MIARTLLVAAALCTQTSGGTIRGEDLALKSHAFAGTYVHLKAAGQITVRLEAPDPAKIAVIVADHRLDGALSLPPGTYFMRIQSAGGDALHLHSVTIEGAEVHNEHSDANALAAADTYIEHFRRGFATVKLHGIAPGTSVRVKLIRHAFNFGTNAPGVENRLLIENAPPASDAERFQRFILENFNMLVPSNAGKWVYHEPVPGEISMNYADDILAFAKRHGLRARMHTLIWDTEQQPQWAQDLLKRALEGDDDAKAELRSAISRRVEYYVRDRAALYDELDVLNESLHRDGYWRVFGTDGLADIYNEVARVAAEVNPNLRLYLNEYNILQWSRPYPFSNDAEPDPHADWYRDHLAEVIAAGGAVSGVGVQYYVDARPDAWKHNPHSPARIFGAMQNLATLDLPITLTEFGIRKEATPEQAADIYDHVLRLSYGTPDATGLLIWGFWAGAVAEKDLGTALVDEQWNLTPAGRGYQRLMSQWTTDDTLTVDPHGTITFTGHFGDYEITVGDRVFPLTLEKGCTHYSTEAGQ